MLGASEFPVSRLRWTPIRRSRSTSADLRHCPERRRHSAGHPQPDCGRATQGRGRVAGYRREQAGRNPEYRCGGGPKVSFARPAAHDEADHAGSNDPVRATGPARYGCAHLVPCKRFGNALGGMKSSERRP